MYTSAVVLDRVLPTCLFSTKYNLIELLLGDPEADPNSRSRQENMRRCPLEDAGKCHLHPTCLALSCDNRARLLRVQVNDDNHGDGETRVCVGNGAIWTAHSGVILASSCQEGLDTQYVPLQLGLAFSVGALSH